MCEPLVCEWMRINLCVLLVPYIRDDFGVAYPTNGRARSDENTKICLLFWRSFCGRGRGRFREMSNTLKTLCDATLRRTTGIAMGSLQLDARQIGCRLPGYVPCDNCGHSGLRAHAGSRSVLVAALNRTTRACSPQCHGGHSHSSASRATAANSCAKRLPS